MAPKMVGTQAGGHSIAGGGGRVPEIDLMRFLAASAVVFYHLAYHPTGADSSLADSGIQQISRYGYLGVNLFFMISGFVILWSSQQRTPTEFIVSRIARLYPSFWVSVLLTALVVNTLGSGPGFSASTIALNLTMVPGLLGAPYVDGVYWTLFVELKFYFLVYLMLITGSMRRVELWLCAWLAASVVCVAGLGPKWLQALVMHPYGPYFISGCYYYLVRERGASPVRVIALLVAGALTVVHAVDQQQDFMHEVSGFSTWVVAASVAAFHLAFVCIARLPAILPDSRAWYWLGALTYPLYLLHNQIGRVLLELAPVSWPQWLAQWVAAAIVYAMAWALAISIERRGCSAFQRWMMRRAVTLRLVRAT